MKGPLLERREREQELMHYGRGGKRATTEGGIADGVRLPLVYFSRTRSRTPLSSLPGPAQHSRSKRRNGGGKRTDSDAESDGVHVELDDARAVFRPGRRCHSSRLREKVPLDAGAEDGQEREREEEVPVDAVFGYVFLRARAHAQRWWGGGSVHREVLSADAFWATNAVRGERTYGVLDSLDHDDSNHTERNHRERFPQRSPDRVQVRAGRRRDGGGVRTAVTSCCDWWWWGIERVGCERRGRKREGLAQEGEGRDEPEGKDERTDAEVHLCRAPTRSGIITLLSIYCIDREAPSLSVERETERLTSEVPQVSALANSRGKAGKSTAKMHRTVMTIMMAR